MLTSATSVWAGKTQGGLGWSGVGQRRRPSAGALVAWIEEIGEVANVMSGLFAVFAGESITCCKSNKTRVVNQISYKMIICVFLCVNIIDCSLILF
jgi:hypothetical protein